MQYFKSVSGKTYAFNDDVNVTTKTGANGFFDSIPSGLTPYTPPAPTSQELLTDAQDIQIRSVSFSYEQAIGDDINFTTSAGVSADYQADASAQQNLIRTLLAYTASKQVPSGFYWVASDNARVPFTFEDLQTLAQDMTNRGWNEFTKLQELKTQILAATTIAAVQALVW